MVQWEDLPASEYVERLYGAFDQPAAVVDSGLYIVWLNDRARALLPFLRSPDGILSMLRDGQAAATAKAIADGITCTVMSGCPPLALTRMFFSPVAREEGSCFSLVLFELPSRASKQLLEDAESAIASYTGQMRGPLSRIFLSLNLLSTNHIARESETILDALKNISQNSYRLLRHCINMTEYSRFVNGLAPENRKTVALTQCLRMLCVSARDLMLESDILFDYTLPAEELYCKCSWRQVELALLNLLSNAARFPRRKNDVRLSLERKKRNAVVTISDRGVGIRSEELAMIFRPFYSTDDHTAQTSGSGLGLTVAKMCVEANGGTIAVQSVPEQGTTVALTLPLSPAPLEQVLHSPSSRELSLDRFGNLYVILSDVCRTPWP